MKKTLPILFILLSLSNCQTTKKRTLRQAYLATDYQFYPAPSDTLHLRADQINPKLDQFLEAYQTWAYITAWNPNSKPLPYNENVQRNQQLVTDLQTKGLKYYSGKGVPDSGNWTPEESFLVVDLTKIEAIEIGLKYGQKAIVWSAIGSPSELIFLRK